MVILDWLFDGIQMFDNHKCGKVLSYTKLVIELITLFILIIPFVLCFIILLPASMFGRTINYLFSDNNCYWQ